MKFRNDVVPREFPQAIALFIGALEPADHFKIGDRQFASRDVAKALYLTAGRWMKHHWGLSEGPGHANSALQVDCARRFEGICHPGDVVGLVIDLVVGSLRSEAVDMRVLIAKTKKHWSDRGLNLDGSVVGP